MHPAGSDRVVPDRELVDGAEVRTDLGAWRVLETPGHAPSHVCLYQPERRLLLSGDHLLGRVSLFFERGRTPDPVSQFLRSLGVVEGLDARLVLAGHGRPFTDIPGHVAANRRLVAERLAAVRAELATGPTTAEDLAARVYGELYRDLTARWLLSKTHCWLEHLELAGEATRLEPSDDGAPQTWARAAA
jgi:glyoxylase-like metal-dependent hydrolase (beta-lactamase superfamily II)